MSDPVRATQVSERPAGVVFFDDCEDLLVGVFAPSHWSSERRTSSYAWRIEGDRPNVLSRRLRLAKRQQVSFSASGGRGKLIVRTTPLGSTAWPTRAPRRRTKNRTLMKCRF